MAKTSTLPENAFVALGVLGESLTQSYNSIEQRSDELSIVDYRRMIDNDGQVQMLWSAIVNSILSVGYSFKDSEQTEEDSKELRFIEDVFSTPYYKGGMKTPLDLVIRHMLRAFIDGFRVFEIVYKVRDDGLIGIDKIAPRSAMGKTGIELLRSDDDDYLGFKQNVSFKGKVIDITVINDGAVKKTINVTYGTEFGSLYGRSGLKSAWYHYDKAHKSMFLNHVGHELGAAKFRYLKTSTTDPDRIGKAIDVLERVHLESVVALPKNDFDLTFESVSDAQIMAVGLEQQDRHYSLIAKSVLAQFIDLGSVTSSGNRALGESQIDFFKQGLQSMATELIENPINQIIVDLVRVNFGTDVVPKIKVNPINDKVSEVILAGFNALINKGEIPEVLKSEIYDKTSQKLGLDITMEELEQERMDKAVVEEKRSKEQLEMRRMELEAGRSAPAVINNNDDLMEGVDVPVDPVRPLFPDEYKVKLADIKIKLDGAETEAERILASRLQQEKNDIVNKYVQALRDGRGAIARTNIQLEEKAGEYEQAMLAIALELLEYGKIVSANELQFAIPNSTKKQRQAITDYVMSIVDEQTARLQLRMKNIANTGLQKNIPENDVRVQLEQEYDSFFSKVLSPTVGLLVSKSFNDGRAITFDKYDSNIFGYRYTAVLDANTTDYCRSLDGRVFQKTDPNYALLTPPQHFGCRSFWTPITKDEASQYNVQVNGKPFDLPVWGSVDQFKDVGTSEKEELLSEIDKTLQTL